MSVIRPLRIDMYCNNNTETALHAAVKGKHYDITLALLNAGANPNLIIKAYLDYNEVSIHIHNILNLEHKFIRIKSIAAVNVSYILLKGVSDHQVDVSHISYLEKSTHFLFYAS